MEQNRQSISATLVRGLLESGKTTWIADFLREDPLPKPVLVIACEEGLEELPSLDGVHCVYIDGEADMTRERFLALEDQYQPASIVIECNAMWRAVGFAMPLRWRPERTVALLDGSMLPVQLSNLRTFLGPVLSRCDEIHINRLPSPEALRSCKASLRALLDNPKVVRLHCADGAHNLDDVPDDVPYDLDQPVVTIAPEHFVYWFHDCRDHPDRYNGKVIAVEGTVKRGPQLGQGEFAIGRMAITCCEADMSFLGYLAHYDGIESLERFAHVAVEARMTYRYLRQYDDVAPYLEVLRLTEHRPQQDYVSAIF